MQKFEFSFFESAAEVLTSMLLKAITESLVSVAIFVKNKIQKVFLWIKLFISKVGFFIFNHPLIFYPCIILFHKKWRRA